MNPPFEPFYFSVLRRFDTPTVLNAIELFNVQPRSAGFADGRMKACFPRMPPMVGYASTATFRSAKAPKSGDVYSGFVDQVNRFTAEIPAPRVIVFEDLDGEPAAATFGEVMCSVYKAFGAVGLITSGAARDLDQVERLGFPCWSSSVIASHGYCRIVDVHVPVRVSGLSVNPGDVIHADRNGIATIPREIVREVALACEKLAQAENEILHYVWGGAPTVEGLREAQKRCQDGFSRIPEAVRAELARGQR